MTVTRYSTHVDLDNLNTSQSLAILSVPQGSRVLDLGAADGSVARRLKERGCTVCGVEFDPAAAAAAREVCDEVLVGDLEGREVWAALGGRTFGVVLALDVLEHLRDPETALKRATEHLEADGMLIISLPNITHGAVRLSLLQGRFQYQPTGLLDATHLKFFDRPAAEEMIRNAGLTISQSLRVTRGLDETEVPVTTDDVVPEVLDVIAADADAATYQFVFVARRASRPVSGLAPDAMLPERLLAQLEALRRQFAEVEQYARSLAMERDGLLARVNEYTDVSRERDELRAELERRMVEAKQRHMELTHAKLDIAVKDALIRELQQEAPAPNAAIFPAQSPPVTSPGVARIKEVVRRIPVVYPVARALVRAHRRRRGR